MNTSGSGELQRCLLIGVCMCVCVCVSDCAVTSALGEGRRDFALMCQARGGSCYGNLTDAAAYVCVPVLLSSLCSLPHSAVLAADKCVCE